MACLFTLLSKHSTQEHFMLAHVIMRNAQRRWCLEGLMCLRFGLPTTEEGTTKHTSNSKNIFQRTWLCIVSFSIISHLSKYQPASHRVNIRHGFHFTLQLAQMSRTSQRSRSRNDMQVSRPANTENVEVDFLQSHLLCPMLRFPRAFRFIKRRSCLPGL